MPAWRREAEARIAEQLGWVDVPWTEWPDTPLPASRIILCLVGHAAPRSERCRLLTEVGVALPPDGILVVVDHNRPRRRSAAARALIGRPWVPGWSPATRWRRLAHPIARELQDVGLRVERLRFAAGERVQIVTAIRA